MAKYLSERQQAVADWLDANGISPNNVPMTADMTIDDRGIRFTSWEQALSDLTDVL